MAGQIAGRDIPASVSDGQALIAGAAGGAWAGGSAGGDPWTEITKSADQTVTNNATMQNDSELSFAVLAGEVYHIQLLLVYSGNNATGDYKCDFTFPTSRGFMRYVGDASTSDAIIQSTGVLFTTGGTAVISLGTDAAHTPRTFMLDMMLRVSANGTVQFRFANNAASAGRESRTKAGTRLRYRKLA